MVPPPKNSLKLSSPEELKLTRGEIALQKEDEKCAAKPLFLRFLFGQRLLMRVASFLVQQ